MVLSEGINTQAPSLPDVQEETSGEHRRSLSQEEKEEALETPVSWRVKIINPWLILSRCQRLHRVSYSGPIHTLSFLVSHLQMHKFPVRPTLPFDRLAQF